MHRSSLQASVSALLLIPWCVAGPVLTPFLLHRPPISKEEYEYGRELAKNYTRMMWRRKVQQDQDISLKLKYKWQAIAALPTPELQREAMIVTDYSVPLRRILPTHWPSDEGFPATPNLALDFPHTADYSASNERDVTEGLAELDDE